MSLRDGGSVQRGPPRWPARPGLVPRRPEPSALYTYLLDADAELADEFDIRGRVAVRQLATARVLHVGVGDCDLSSWFEIASQGPGLLILDGLHYVKSVTHNIKKGEYKQSFTLGRNGLISTLPRVPA